MAGADCRRFERAQRARGRIRALSRQLQPPIMYTPVILSAALFAGGSVGFFQPARGARRFCRRSRSSRWPTARSGFYFHVRGIHRKPVDGGLPIVNMVMGPPVFAPLLFGVSAYSGSLPRSCGAATVATAAFREPACIGALGQTRYGRT